MNNELTALRRKYSDFTPGLLGTWRRGAVLCPLLERADGLQLLFEVRAAQIPQGGDVCFPGGECAPGESPEDCVLRELQEELAVPPAEITLLGRSNFTGGPRGFFVQPVLGLLSEKGFSGIRRSPDEVAEVFTVPLRFLRETPMTVRPRYTVPSAAKRHSSTVCGDPLRPPQGGDDTEIPVWVWKDHIIWGLTARIIFDILLDVDFFPRS